MSPAATLAPDEARELALGAADELFYSRGVAAVTMAALRDESGVSLRRLYSMFPAKSDLVSAWLCQRHDEWMAMFSAAVAKRLEAGEPPDEAVFNSLDDWMTATDFRGCGFINTQGEASELTDDHRAIIRTHKRAVADYLETVLPQGRAVAVLVDGAIVQASIFRSADPIHVARAAATTLIMETS